MLNRGTSVGRWLLSISALVILAATLTSAADYEIIDTIGGANILSGEAPRLA